MAPAKNTEEVFWARIKPVESGCWEWQGGRSVSGYGYTKFAGRQQRVHRVAYVLKRGPIPEGMQVCHTCDNPRCCNPDHLWLGTASDNAGDKIAKGRCSNRKLAADDATAIRYRFAAGETHEELATCYGVNAMTIWEIVRGRTWKDAAGPIAPVGQRRQTPKPPKIKIIRPRKERAKKLTNDDVLTIRTLYANGGQTCGTLAKRYSVGLMTISRIVRGEIWQHVDGPRVYQGRGRRRTANQGVSQ